MFGLRLGKLGAAIKAGTGSVGVVPLFSRDYEAAGSLGANATFARSSSATIIDHEGVIRTVPSDAARFNGLRYVRNLCSNAPDFSDWTINATYVGTRTLGITDPFGGNTAAIFDANLGTDGYFGPSTIYNVGASAKGIVSVFVRRISGSGEINVRTPDNANVIIYPTSEWQRFSCASSAYYLGNFYGQIIVQNGSSIAVACYQLENATGRADTTTPSEYVSVGVLSAPYHGANVDGIKYFATENGNSVVSNVVTEGTGAAIAGGYLLMEPAATNRCDYSEAFDNAAWTKSNCTITANSIASPAGATTADTLTATAANASCLDSITLASSTVRFSVYLKRKTGTGNIDLTVDGGSTWTTKAITSEWARYDITQAAVTNPNVGIRIVTSGDEVYAWGAQLTQQSAISSYIPTSGSAVTRAAETLSYSGIAADNETRAITDAGTVDTDDWDGIVDATINGADNLAQITSIDVYTTGERPA